MESVIESFRVCRLSAPFFCALIKSFFHCFLSVSVLPSNARTAAKAPSAPRGAAGQEVGGRYRNKVPPTGRTRLFLFQDIKVSLFVFYFILFIAI